MTLALPDNGLAVWYDFDFELALVNAVHNVGSLQCEGSEPSGWYGFDFERFSDFGSLPSTVVPSETIQREMTLDRERELARELARERARERKRERARERARADADATIALADAAIALADRERWQRWWDERRRDFLLVHGYEPPDRPSILG